MWQQLLTLFLALMAVQPAQPCCPELDERLEQIDAALGNINTKINEHLKNFRNFQRNEFTSLQEQVASINATLFKVSSKVDEQMVLLQNIFSHVTQTSTPTTDDPAVHPCGGSGHWRRVAFLDMTNPSQTCPSGWSRQTSYPKRTCGRLSKGPLTCDPVIFPVVDGNYSRVCGRIRAYQYSAPDGFENYNSNQSTTIEGAYVSGVSVTHGTPRDHIWTFAAGISEGNPEAPDVCPCHSSNTILTPDFVGNDYFCESGVNEAWDRSKHWETFVGNDPLWDGQNCRPTSGCCTLNNPPYFVKELPSSSADDIEVRICLLDDSTDSDVPIEQLELYVQ